MTSEQLFSYIMERTRVRVR